MGADLNTGRQRYIHAVGCVALQWNLLEVSLDRFIWGFLDNDHELGCLITGRIGNNTKTDLLLDLAALKERDSRVTSRIEHAVKCFHICRENRNIVAHAVAFGFYGRKGWMLGKRSKGSPAKWSGFRLKLSDIKRVQNEIVRTDAFVQRLHKYRFDQWRLSLVPSARNIQRLPKKPLLPRKLAPLPPEALPSDWRPL